MRELVTQYARPDGSDDDVAIDCPNCRCRFVPLDPIAGLSTELPRGTMFAAYCPRCGHGVYVRQLNEPLDPDDDDAA